MAQISMKYILLKKTVNDEDFELIDVVKRFFRDNYDAYNDEGIINIENCVGKLSYSIKQNNDSDRCFLYLHSEQYINDAAKCVEEVNTVLNKSDLRKYFYLLKSYDGLSEYYCEKLYPKYAEYERKLRYMVLLMVTKAYGGVWVTSTLDENVKNSVLDKARKKNITDVPMDAILEYFELKQLENYLFEPPKVDMNKFVDEELTSQRMQILDKNELCEIIEKAKNPTCLWDRVFSNIGDMAMWKEAMKDVHDVRNSVAHHKTVTSEEYKVTLKQLKNINNMLDDAIESVLSKELESTKMIDILGSFAVLAGKTLLKQMDYSSISEMVVSFSRRMNELVIPIECNFQQNMIELIKESALRYSSFDIAGGYKEALQNIANTFVLHNGQISKSLDAMGSIWKQYQIDAIGFTTRFENLAKQIGSIPSVSNKE